MRYFLFIFLAASWLFLAARPARAEGLVPTYPRLSPEELKQKISDQSFRVTQQGETERPFTGEYWDEERPGIYVDVTTGEPLFFSFDKYDAGCGWPSFVKPISEDLIKEYKDLSHGMVRTEVKSRSGDAHLGHVFTDGPVDRGGLRYCINSASLTFIPFEEMETKGYGYLIPAFEAEQPSD